ncbi:MAG: ABC transporter permease [Lachnospiraceae bacterium]|nr:ABC transporter permease [Lachnospiraceae bacterium]
MRLTELLRLVWTNLVQNKSKVILTSFGIVVGSATIMLVIAIGQGGQMEVAEQFKNLNAGAVDVTYDASNAFGRQGSSSGSGMQGPGGFPGGGGMAGGSSRANRPSGGFPGGGMPGGMSGGEMPGFFPGGGADSRINQEAVSLTQEDMEDLEVFVPGLSDVTISFSTKSDVEGGELESSTSYTIAGVKSNYAQISNLDMVLGEFLTEANEEGKEKVCVLGYSVAKEIFGSVYDAYDGTIYIDGRPYLVNGVLEEMGSIASGISPDDAVFIPYETGIKYLTGTNVSPTITVIAEDVGQVEMIKTNIETVLADSYPNTEFTISDAGSKMEAAEKSNETLTMLLFAMAAIVFVVGGIGIMNVLFVSVKERTNEIGILKAIGCSRKDILLEFVLEASCISLVGAVLGVLVALGITPLIEQFSVRVELSVLGAVLSLTFGVITGTVFGFYPAYKASTLIPVVALNQE